MLCICAVTCTSPSFFALGMGEGQDRCQECDWGQQGCYQLNQVLAIFRHDAAKFAAVYVLCVHMCLTILLKALASIDMCSCCKPFYSFAVFRCWQPTTEICCDGVAFLLIDGVCALVCVRKFCKPHSKLYYGRVLYMNLETCMHLLSPLTLI